MSLDSTAKKILEAARAEFLEKGFEKSSMRSIAAKVGITATALYRHYQDKESIFDALVLPATHLLQNTYDEIKDSLYTTLAHSGPEAMWEQENGNFAVLVDQIYANFDAYKLILCCSAGTKHTEYIHELVNRMQEDTFYFMETAKANGHPIKDVDPMEFHLLLSAQYFAFFEMVKHDFSYEQALHYADVLEEFFRPSWKAFLGF